MTQTLEIREYLLTHPEGITPMDALELFGCFRLGARIHDIKNGKGCNPLPVETINETKGGKTYARYKAMEFKAPKTGHYMFTKRVGADVVSQHIVEREIPKINLLPNQQESLF